MTKPFLSSIPGIVGLLHVVAPAHAAIDLSNFVGKVGMGSDSISRVVRGDVDYKCSIFRDQTYVSTESADGASKLKVVEHYTIAFKDAPYSSWRSFQLAGSEYVSRAYGALYNEYQLVERSDQKSIYEFSSKELGVRQVIVSEDGISLRTNGLDGKEWKLDCMDMQ